jgi:hypothetical protein
MEADVNAQCRMRVYLSSLARAEWPMPGIQQTESEWSQLIAMLELVQRWEELIGEFTREDAHPDGANADDLCSASPCSNTTRR